jgi:hypothetical protein
MKLPAVPLISARMHADAGVPSRSLRKPC